MYSGCAMLQLCTMLWILVCGRTGIAQTVHQDSHAYCLPERTWGMWSCMLKTPHHLSCKKPVHWHSHACFSHKETYNDCTGCSAVQPCMQTYTGNMDCAACCIQRTGCIQCTMVHHVHYGHHKTGFNPPRRLSTYVYIPIGTYSMRWQRGGSEQQPQKPGFCFASRNTLTPPSSATTGCALPSHQAKVSNPYQPNSNQPGRATQVDVQHGATNSPALHKPSVHWGQLSCNLNRLFSYSQLNTTSCGMRSLNTARSALLILSSCETSRRN